jgi:hypothetical protein
MVLIEKSSYICLSTCIAEFVINLIKDFLFQRRRSLFFICLKCFVQTASKAPCIFYAGEIQDKIEILYGKICYVVSSLSISISISIFIYLIDSFGFEFINAKLLADRMARETSVQVLVPDVIPGGRACRCARS